MEKLKTFSLVACVFPHLEKPAVRWAERAFLAAVGLGASVVVGRLAAAATRVWRHFTPQWRGMREHLLSSVEGMELARKLQFYDLPLWFLLSNRGWWYVAGMYCARQVKTLFVSESGTEAAHGMQMFYFVPAVDRDVRLADPTKWCHTGLRQAPWWNKEDLPGVEGLVENVAQLREEYEEGVRKALSQHPDWAGTGSGKGQWQWNQLYGIGGWADETLERMPVSARVVRDLDVCLNFGFVFYSRMLPDSHILPHTGSTNLRIRVHLGLAVPTTDETLRMVVGGEARPWAQDDVIIFDDSFTHEAYNRGEEPRTVLIADLWHPDLLAKEKKLLSSPLFSSFGKVPK